MPLWMPATEDRIGFNRWDLSRPLAAGLKYRPLEVTARDTLDFHKSRPLERQQELRAGISAEREAELLAEENRITFETKVEKELKKIRK